MGVVRIALANIRPAATPPESIALTRAAVEAAGEENAAIVCFPECYVPGYRTPGTTLPPPDTAFLEGAWRDIAESAAAASVAVVLGTERLVGGAPRITAVVIDGEGTIRGFQDKVQLDPSEEGLYLPGAERRLFQVGPLTFGVAICHEGWRYPETVRWPACRGAQIVFHPHFHEAEPGGYRPTTFADPRNTFHEKAMLCRAAENGCYFASVNCAGPGVPTTSAVVGPRRRGAGLAAVWRGRAAGDGHRPRCRHGIPGQTIQADIVDINRNAPVQAEAGIEIAAPPGLVWSVQADLESWPRWNPDVKSIRSMGPLEPGTAFEWKAGGMTILSELGEVDPPFRLGWTGRACGLRAIHVWEFTESGTGARVRTAESFEGALATVAGWLLRKSLRTALERGLLALKAESERRAAAGAREPITDGWA